MAQNETESRLGPFIQPGRSYGAVDVQGRLDMVTRFDADECRRALEVPGLQKTVEAAIRRRLRQLEKGA